VAYGRRELRETVGERSGDVPYLLRGLDSRKGVRMEQLLDGLKGNGCGHTLVPTYQDSYLTHALRVTYTLHTHGSATTHFFLSIAHHNHSIDALRIGRVY
jgi:hypothetical protein